MDNKNFRENFGLIASGRVINRNFIPHSQYNRNSFNFNNSFNSRNCELTKIRNAEPNHFVEKFSYKTKVCNKKFTKNCHMGTDCTFLHLDENTREVFKRTEPPMFDNYEKYNSNKKIKLELNDDNVLYGYNNDDLNQWRKPQNMQGEENTKYFGDETSCSNYETSYTGHEKDTKNKNCQVYFGLCYNLNNIGTACNIYANTIGNYNSTKNLIIVSVISDILHNLDKITCNAIMLRSLLQTFPLFKKLYDFTANEKIKLAAQDPIYEIRNDDSDETKQEKLKIISMDKLNYTNMVLAHQTSLISAIYKYNNYQGVDISTSLINVVSKYFVVELYLRFYYLYYRPVITDEMCQLMLEKNNNEFSDVARFESNYGYHEELHSYRGFNLSKTDERLNLSKNDERLNLSQNNERFNTRSNNTQHFNNKDEMIKEEIINQYYNEDPDSVDETSEFLRYFRF